jgi:ParB/RepB/Spo0J family partition protein
MNPVMLIALDRLRPKPGQVRQTFYNINELAESIERHGLMQNLVVRPLAEPGYYEIIAGERRYRALKLLESRGALKNRSVPCLVREGDRLDQDVFANIAENVMRDDVPIWELGRVYLMLSDSDLTQAEIAARIGKSQGHVSTAIMIAKNLAPAVIQRLAQAPPGSFPVQRLIRLAKLVDRDGEPDEGLQLRMYKQMLESPGRRGPGPTRVRVQKQTVWDRFQRLKQGKAGRSIDPLYQPFLDAVIKYLSGETKGLNT